MMATDFSRAFAEAGLCIVSGMAKGIDAAAHEGALLAKGATIAILGSGVDVPYPAENKRLYERIKENGLVISEYFPGEKPLHWHFPHRNRIISGLSRFVLLVEGEARSGALITCGLAAEQGKDVWALPGPVTNPSSIGPLLMIRDGAQIAITPQDMLKSCFSRDRTGFEEDSLEKEDTGQLVLPVQEKEIHAALNAREKKLFETISYCPVHVNSLLTFYASRAGGYTKSDGRLYMDLTKLITLRLIEKLPGDYYQRI